MPTVTSTASVVLAKEETFGFDNLAPLAGGFRNTFFNVNSAVVWGKTIGKFTFVFERVVFKFANMTPAIPANAKIVSCVLRGTPTVTSDSNGFFTVIFPHAKDGFWDPVDSGRIWRRVGNVNQADMRVELLDAFLNTIVETAQVTNQVWGIRDNGLGRYLRIGQGVTSEDTKTIVFCDIELRRQGAVAVGNIWAEIYSQVDGFADTLLATSDTRPASSAPTNLADFRFTFTGGELYNITDGEKVVVVLNGDYVGTATDRIQVGWRHLGSYAPGFMATDGTGIAFDDQNYGLHSDYRASIPNAATGPSPFVVWVAPQFVIAVPVSTPNLSNLFQQVISSPSYSQGEAFSWAVAMSEFLFPGVTAQRAWANALHATLAPVEMIVEWKERAVRVAA